LSRAPFAASSCSAPPGRRAPLTLSRALVPQLLAARRPLRRRAPLTSSRVPFAATSCSAPLGRRAPLTSSRKPFAATSCSAPPWTPRAAHFEPRALCSLELLGAPLDAARRSLRAARPLQPRAARRPLGRRAPLTSSRAPFAAWSSSAPPWTPRAAHFELRALCSLELLGAPWTPRAAHFEPRALCSLELLGAPLDAARRSLRAARPLQPRAARRPLGRRAPLTSTRALCAASSCSAPPWTPRAAHFEPRALCSLELLGAPWTPRAAHFEPRALCSLELLGAPLDAARRSF